MAANNHNNDPPKFFIGVDVGTASVRAGLFNSCGKLLAHDKHDIHIWCNESIAEGSYEQSSEDIWQAVCTVVKSIIKGVDPLFVHGIGFDATCSLVAVDTDGCPVTVSLSGDPQRNIVLWKDHRALKETNDINKLGHHVLKFVGGVISPEMQPPKLLWLKRNLFNECWKRTSHFFDLADYLVYKSTGVSVRSLCTLVCKWTYKGHCSQEDDPCYTGWSDSFWRGIGLGDLVDEDYSRIGTVVMSPGERVGNGLLPSIANELGLVKKTPVAVSLIDAHAGGLGMLGADMTRLPYDSAIEEVSIVNRLAIIAGTSSCHMATSKIPLFVPGVWGPYYSAMVPGYYLNEGGQSATGSLLDYILKLNGDTYKQLTELAKSNGHSIYSELDHILSAIAEQRSLPHVYLLTSDIHVVPDFHGNRSPLADPAIKGMISGLSLNNSIEEIAILYLATVQSLAYSTKHILEVMSASGHSFNVIFVCGGLGQNSLYLQSHSDITGLTVLLPEEAESVLLGSAILAKAAADNIPVTEVMGQMSRVSLSSVYKPIQDTNIIRYHEKKYTVFRAMLSDQIKYRNLMQQ